MAGVSIFLAVMLAVMCGCALETEVADYAFHNGAEPETLDPAIATGVPENRIMRELFEGLTTLHPRTLEPLPGVAEAWELSDDGRVYTFHLRRDARWSDGSPVTAEDFEYSWRRVLTPATAADYVATMALERQYEARMQDDRERFFGR